jgi:hypothetical protein
VRRLDEWRVDAVAANPKAITVSKGCKHNAIKAKEGFAMTQS